jgi:hypothetical protein
MDWERFQLTSSEAKHSSKYEDPRKTQRAVLRRCYYAELNISSIVRNDSVNFQISRRARILALTAAGDVDKFNLEIIDVTGEQYTAGPTHLPLLLSGWTNDPRSATAQPMAMAMGPYNFEPNIVTMPNQTIQLNSFPTNTANVSTTYLIGVTLHVVEFPGAPGSPM